MSSIHCIAVATQDLPHGLAVLRGIAEICDVDAPMMDTVLTWAQVRMRVHMCCMVCVCVLKLNGEQRQIVDTPHSFTASLPVLPVLAFGDVTVVQEKVGHEYLVDGKIQGKDVAHSGCPQVQGGI